MTVSNSTSTEIAWDYITIDPPQGDNAAALTDVFDAINARIELDYKPLPGDEPAEFFFVSTASVFMAGAPSGREITLPAGGSFTLILENFPVSGVEGLARLKLREKAKCDEGALLKAERGITFRLPKSAPKVPRNFRSTDVSLLDEDKQVELQWNGPSNLDYWIRFPDGRTERVAQAGPGPSVVDQPYTWRDPNVLKRDATYTLIAGTESGGQPQYGYFLTATVHARIPEFESGMRTPWIEGLSSGRIEFSKNGLFVLRGKTREWGTISAQQADVTSVKTEWVQGREDNGGLIEFPEGGLRVLHGEAKESGTIWAHRANLFSMTAKWVRGSDHNGMIEFGIPPDRSRKGLHIHGDLHATGEIRENN